MRFTMPAVLLLSGGGPGKGGMGTLYVNDFNKAGRTFRVQLQAEAPYRMQPQDLGKIHVRTAAGHIEPLAAVNKVNQGRPHVVDMIKNNEIAFIVNTVDEKRTAIADSRSIRTSALAAKVTLYTTVEGGLAACEGMRHAGLETYSVQSLHTELQ